MPKVTGGISFEAKAIFRQLALRSELKANAAKAQHVLDSSIIRDTDPFVPMDTGMLARSAETASAIGKGEIVYDTPYARRIYYGLELHISKLHHPNASVLWFQQSKAMHEKRWIAEVERILKGGNGR